MWAGLSIADIDVQTARPYLQLIRPAYSPLGRLQGRAIRTFLQSAHTARMHSLFAKQIRGRCIYNICRKNLLEFHTVINWNSH